MKKKFYLHSAEHEECYVEVTETEWLAIIGDNDHRKYASQVYRGEISIEEVPEDKRKTVTAIVNNKIARWGAYNSREIFDSEALKIITGGNA